MNVFARTQKGKKEEEEEDSFILFTKTFIHLKKINFKDIYLFSSKEINISKALPFFP